MKKYLLSTLADGICVVLLSVCPILCYASAFSVKLEASVLIMAAVLFSIVFSLLSAFVKNNLKYALCMTVIAFVAFLVFVFANESIFAQANYAINKLLELYSVYLSVYSNIKFASYIANDATGFFVLLSLILNGLFSFLISRIKSIKIAGLLSIALLVPCFVLVNTLPDLVPLLIIFTVLFALYFSSQTRQLNYAHSGVITAGCAVILAVLITVLAVINPVANYERPKWQDNMLNTVQTLTGMKTYNGSGKISSALAEVGNNVSSEVDFSNAGALTQTGKKVMTVTSSTDGRIYLKSMAYANYENNKWSVLTDEQANDYPQDFQAFIMTANYQERSTVTIDTVNKESIVYTPYYLASINDTFSPVCDVLVSNSDKATNYSMSVMPYSESELDNFSMAFSSPVYDYDNFVKSYYLKLPYDTKLAMLKIAEENNLTGVSTQNIPQAVKQFVSHSASYSLNTQKVPDGRDVAEWFLNDAQTGYCMHFANAAAVMLRALGVPARYVTGYCADVVDGKAIVTSDNAHAWVEYFDERIGWIPLDATSSDFEVPQATESVQTTTQAQTTSPTVQPTTQAQNTKPVKTEVKAKISTPAIIVIIILLIIALEILRIILIRYYRKYSFTHKDYKSRVICIYRYLNKLSVHSKVRIPKKIENICTKAKFSTHNISDEEYKIVLNYVLTFRNKTIGKMPIVKKLYCIIILGI
ncbi:transglutaminase domain-containing protein [uncultured Ruminococcus sp.]|uniref:transglutaminase-like domain-containing protein n=1 Tax=uncultured Ruminococcus sp. TaxID=165186 RepID=UPI0025E39D15|nr:transglutaminase domain-containing protein [uncultured Ruminococcus sp.]